MDAREDPTQTAERERVEAEDRERVRGMDTRVAVQVFGSVVGALGAYGAVALAPLAPVVAGVGAGIALAGAGLVWASSAGAPGRALREARVTRSLRKRAALEGVIVPIERVSGPDGDCCAFDHVVHRCDACDCVRPCGRIVKRFRWEERRAGRFLVRGEERWVWIDRGDVHFVTTVGEKAASRFLRVDAGERVRIRGDFEELESLPDAVREALASHRDAPRVLAPRAGTPVLVERLAP